MLVYQRVIPIIPWSIFKLSHGISHYIPWYSIKKTLVGGAITILTNMSSSMGRMTTHILWKIKNVWNHQPDTIFHCRCIIADIPAAQSLACRVSSSKTSSSLSQVVFKRPWTRWLWINTYVIGGIPTPLKNMSSSDWIIIPTIGEHEKHVPNHQPAINTILTGMNRLTDEHT